MTGAKEVKNFNIGHILEGSEGKEMVAYNNGVRSGFIKPKFTETLIFGLSKL